MNNDDSFTPFDRPNIEAPLNELWAAKREVARATRQLIGDLMIANCDAATLRAVARVVGQQSELLAKGPVLRGMAEFASHEDGRHGSTARISYEMNSLAGSCNPISPPLTMWIDGDVAHGRATMGWQYEGPPASVHGGFICALLDQFLGAAQSLAGQPGFTGTLTTRFIRLTPIDTELHLIARIKEVAGRKIILTGEILANGIVTASCEGVFISVSPERFRELQLGN